MNLLGLVCRLEEEAKSLSYYLEAHRAWPVNLDVISWLGAFHVRNEVGQFVDQ
jgi:intraflagellar transport protein 88